MKRDIFRYVLSAAHCANKTHARLGEWKIVDPDLPDFDSCTYYNDKSRELCFDEDGKASNPAFCYENKDCLSICKNPNNQDCWTNCLGDQQGEECFDLESGGCIYGVNKVYCNRKHDDCNDKTCQMGKAKVDCESKDGKDPICAPEHQVRKAWDIK